MSRATTLVSSDTVSDFLHLLVSRRSKSAEGFPAKKPNSLLVSIAVAVLSIGGIGSRLGRQLWKGAVQHGQSALTSGMDLEGGRALRRCATPPPKFVTLIFLYDTITVFFPRLETCVSAHPQFN